MFITGGFQKRVNDMLKKQLLIILLAGLVLSQYCQADTASAIIVRMNLPENPWADSRLGEKLDMHLSTISHVPITRDYDCAELMSTPYYQDLNGVAKAMNGRFLVDILINRIDLEKRKVTVIPQLIFRYRVYGVVTGKIRIVDLKKDRIIEMSDINCDLKAKDRWQFVDDDAGDADLRLASDKKILLFDELEDKAAEEIFKKINKLVRSNNFGG